MKKLLLAAIAASAVLPCMGQATLVLKNGSRIYGNVSNDDFANSVVTFSADSAVVVDTMSYSAPVVRALSSLNDAWQNWFAGNARRVFTHNNAPSAYIGKVSCMQDENRPFNGEAVILENGNGKVKFFVTGLYTTEVNKRLIDHFEYAERDPLALTGVIDEVVTVDGEVFTGQIVAKYTAGIVVRTENGVDNFIPFENVMLTRIVPFNVNYPLKDQVRYHSRLNYKNGKTNNEVTGIIQEVVYKPKNGAKPYYTVLNADGTSSTDYNFEDVEGIRSVRNSSFVDKRDVVIKKDEVLVAGKPGKKVTLKEGSDRYVLPDSVEFVEIKFSDLKDARVPVHYKNTPDNNEFFFVELTVPVVEKKKPGLFGAPKVTEPEAPYVTFAKLLRGGFRAEDRFVSPANNISVQYGPLKKGGRYVLIRKSDLTAYPIVVK